MKALLCMLLLAFTFQAEAATKTLLFCKNIDQDDLKTITIQKNANIKAEGLLELLEQHTDGSKKDLMATSQDLEDGYVPMSSHDGTERILLRRNGKWTVAGIKGDYRFFSNADCVE
ncbi:MAG: hypothetical protein J7501_10600 [Bdellovibrio sp.]|nr:hypothetical protein [Bdellovibrio sp.]